MSTHSEIGQLTLSKLILSLILGSLLFSACRKESFESIQEVNAKANACKLQTDNPVGRSYSADSVLSFTCYQSHCGILPLSITNYWVYEDSIFTNGVFTRVQIDTLHYTANYTSLEDELVWWQGNIYIGLPDVLYANDSTFFGLVDRMYNPGIKDVKKDYSLFTGDSIKYLTSFEDNAAMGRSLKLTDDVITPAGNFDNCIYFEKNARNYRKDQVIFRPGLGVIRYIREKAPVGSREIKLQQISTLIAYHLE